MIADKHIINYINNAKKIPLLTKEQEIQLSIEATGGSNKAAQDLVKANLLLVVKIANEYVSMFNNIDDLIEEGNVGLIRSIKKYDPNKGYRFSTYATWWIRSLILRYIFNNSHMIRPGSTNDQKKLFYNLRKEQKRLEELGVETNAATIADNLDVSENNVIEMDNRLRSDVYLDAPLSLKYDARMVDKSDQPDHMIEAHDLNQKLKIVLDKFVAKLKNNRHKEIYHKRIMSDEPMTLQALADVFQISKERIRQNEEEIEKKLYRYVKKHMDK